MPNMGNIILAFCLLVLAAGCSNSYGPPASEVDTGELVFADEYRIGIGDVLDISVWKAEELSATVPVRPDGKITVPVAGDMMVGGKTTDEVTLAIKERLREFLREPVVTVIVASMGSSEYLSRVRVTGAVQTPVSLPFRSGMTVMDIVLEAGGVSEFGNGSRAFLYREDGSKLDLRLDRILERGDMRTNYALRPGDVITVPERLF